MFIEHASSPHLRSVFLDDGASISPQPAPLFRAISSPSCDGRFALRVEYVDALGACVAESLFQILFREIDFQVRTYQGQGICI